LETLQKNQSILILPKIWEISSSTKFSGNYKFSAQSRL